MNRRRRSDHSPLLLAYTGAQIVLGLLVFVWAIEQYPIDPRITLTEAGGREGVLLGLIFWILIGLLGSTRVERLHGHGVLTFHIPFIVAAMALGGPVAGGVVAAVSTIERREITELPWYGTLANHAALTLSGVIGGLVLVNARGVLGAEVAEQQAVELIAIVLGSFVLTVLSSGLAVGTIVLRDRLSLGESTRVYDGSYRVTAASEVVLGWVLAFTYVTVGWWSALIVATLVLVVWQGHDAREVSSHDPLTGLLTRPGFDAHMKEAIKAAERRGQSAALLAVDLDKFKAVNDEYGHASGDEVLRVVGARLRGSIRLIDAAVRRGGDEFGVLLVDVHDLETATALAMRIHERLCEPIELEQGAVQVGASIGLYLIEPAERVPSAGRMHDLADGLMYEAKRAGEPLRVSRTVKAAENVAA